MTPDDRWIDRARFDAEHARRVWAGSADAEDAPAWYGRVATLIRGAAAATTEDELAGEADIVARMQAAILEPAPDDELDGEPDIVARMQATILDLRDGTERDGVGDDDRPRHLRAAAGGRDGARRHGARVVSRIVAAKAAAITTVVAIGVTAAAATTGIVATVVVPALTSHDPKPPHEEPQTRSIPEGGSPSDSSGETDHGVGHGSGGSEVITYDPEEPLVCILNLDCLVTTMKQAARVEAAGPVDAQSATPPTTESPTPPTTEPPPAPPTTEPPTPPTTEPPTPPTTEPPTTTTTEPPPPTPEVAAPASAPSGELAASTGDSGGTPGVTAAAAEPLPAG